MPKLLETLGLEPPGRSGKEGTKPTPLPVTKKPGALVLREAVIEVPFADLGKLDALVMARVQREGDGKVEFNPPLGQVTAPGDHAIKLRVAEGTGHLATDWKNVQVRVGKRDPKLAVKPQANFEFGSKPSLVADLRALVSREGDGEIRFDPKLESVGAAGPYKLKVSVAEGTQHKSAGPLPLEFEILRADPQLKLKAALPTFVLGADVEAAVRGAVEWQGDGVIAFAPALATLTTAGTHAVDASVAQGTNHRASAQPLPLSVVVKKRDARIALKSKVVQESQDDKAKPDAAALRRKALALLNGGLLEDLDGSKGAVTVNIGGATYVPGVHKVQVWLAESATHEASNKETLDFRVLMSPTEANMALAQWIASEKQLTKAQKKMLTDAKLDPGPVFIGKAKEIGFATTSEVVTLAQATVGAIALPQLTRADMWRMMGHDSITTTGSWIIAKKSKVGTKTIHLTVSGDSINLPKTLTGTAAVLWDEMFDAVEWKFQVHATLEIGDPTPHVYLDGTVDKKGKVVSAVEVKAMNDMLTDFKTNAVAELDTNRGQLANYRVG